MGKRYAGITNFGHLVKDTVTGKSMEFATDSEALEFLGEYIKERCKDKEPVKLEVLDQYQNDDFKNDDFKLDEFKNDDFKI